jgi:hypothetical protein
MKMFKYLKHEVEIENISYDEKDEVFVVEYSVYDMKGKHILTDTARITHDADMSELYFDAMEKLKEVLKNGTYGTKTKN